LQDQIMILERKSTEFQDQAIRAQAELENVRRRMEQEVAKARKFGVERLAADLIPAVDSLARGLKDDHAKHNDLKAVRHGMELTLDMLRKALEKNGIIMINPAVGDAFDPAQHEAMSTQSDADAKPHTILQVLEQGYALNGRVLRAAMVIVST